MTHLLPKAQLATLYYEKGKMAILSMAFDLIGAGKGIIWVDMDRYFSDLYDYVHKHYPGVRVFTPPMGQGFFAENIFLASLDIPCEPMLVAGRQQSGYAVMRSTYGTRNDGFSFHNYWAQGKEFYKERVRSGDDSGWRAA